MGFSDKCEASTSPTGVPSLQDAIFKDSGSIVCVETSHSSRVSVCNLVRQFRNRSTSELEAGMGLFQSDASELAIQERMPAAFSAACPALNKGRVVRFGLKLSMLLASPD